MISKQQFYSIKQYGGREWWFCAHNSYISIGFVILFHWWDINGVCFLLPPPVQCVWWTCCSLPYIALSSHFLSFLCTISVPRVFVGQGDLFSLRIIWWVLLMIRMGLMNYLVIKHLCQVLNWASGKCFWILLVHWRKTVDMTELSLTRKMHLEDSPLQWLWTDGLSQ